jgi:hypothetical protein
MTMVGSGEEKEAGLRGCSSLVVEARSGREQGALVLGMTVPRVNLARVSQSTLEKAKEP